MVGEYGAESSDQTTTVTGKQAQRQTDTQTKQTDRGSR